MELDSIRRPPGLGLCAGGSREKLLAHLPLPDVALASRDRDEILALLSFAGVRYTHSQSPAAEAGVRLFDEARAFAQRSPYEAVTFDWDHTFSNYRIFEHLPLLLKVHRSARPPPAHVAAMPMVAVEMTRPFMVELALGMMVGFAMRQGLSQFREWDRYSPRVGIVSLTWPDRLARLATHYVPILSLMEGLVPGQRNVYDAFMSPEPRSVVHLHNFLDYAEALLRRAADGEELTPLQEQELIALAADGRAHRRKPLGAWRRRGWPIAHLLHIDDSTVVVGDIMRQAEVAKFAACHCVHVPHPHSRVFENIREWHKISVPAFWQSRPVAVRAVIEGLTRQEWKRSAIPALTKHIGVPLSEYWPAEGLPEGTVLTVHETPTTLGEFWRFYVAPTRRLRGLVKSLTQRAGGLSGLRRMFPHDRAA